MNSIYSTDHSIGSRKVLRKIFTFVIQNFPLSQVLTKTTLSIDKNISKPLLVSKKIFIALDSILREESFS
jgi:hypothetical protein